jgi:protein-tyrosine phosphatase
VELFQIDDDGHLFISPAIEDWSALEKHRIDTVIDLDGGLDTDVPTLPDHWLYVYFPIYDEDLPNSAKLHAVAVLGASLVRARHRVLSHCGLGFNRSALIAGLILCELGYSGADAVSRLRQRRPGALFNDTFAAYLSSRG